MTRMDFTELTRYMDSLSGVGVPGCDLIVCRDHETVYRHMAGCRDGAGLEPMRGDEVYCLYSCTKVFTTCAAMQLVGRGLIHPEQLMSATFPFTEAAAAIRLIREHPERVCKVRLMFDGEGGR